MPQTKHFARGKQADSQSHKRVSDLIEAPLLKEVQAARETLRCRKPEWFASQVFWVADGLSAF